ncbi:MAG: SDR family oxidoreductase [Herpetosiphonaceae bacterium]|nr:SDR family oxidoreductase [Herpetosiphonaceae bacterium]
MQQLFSLEGKSALITGGNGGIGRALALGFQASGAKVAVTGRNPTKNEAIGKELGDPHAVFVLDVRDEAAVQATITEVVAQFGHLDIIVNNAGLFPGGSVLELSLDSWNAVIASHLTGAFLCTKYGAQAMVAQGRGGKIINIGSMYSIFGPHHFPNYGAAKAGMLGLTRSTAVDLAPYNIQANAILPGWYETESSPPGAAASPIGEQIRRKTPAGRWGNLEDLVGTGVFLASAASDFVTGVSIPVDGGYSIADQFRDE